MNCEILETLYLRSNGDVPCNDDAGEKITLGQLGETAGSLEAVLHNSHYQQIRARLAGGLAPWPGVCEGCAFFRPLEQHDDSLARRRIRKIQIETSLACRLRCPGCSNSLQITYRPKPWFLPLATLRTLLTDLADARFDVEEVEYCGQGEPLLHPDFPVIIEAVRARLPGARQRLITSGNADYSTSVGGRAIDEIFVSCDGVDQTSYEQYRVRGNVEVALQFLADIPATRDGIRQTKVWKYILFEFNDSDEEIRRAQELAQDLHVDTLLFVYTHSAQRSVRWTAENAGDFPRLYPNVTTSATPIHDQHRQDGVARGEWQPIRRRHRATAHAILDEMIVRDDSFAARGWAWSESGVRQLDVLIDGTLVGQARTGLARKDVAAVYPDYGERTGFTLNGRLDGGLEPGGHVLTVRLRGTDGRTYEISNDYNF